MSDFDQVPTAYADAVPPQDIAAEQAALGAMMLNPAVADEIGEMLYREDFYRPIHATIFDAILAVAARSEPADMIAVGHHLDAAEDLKRVGGLDYLHTLTQIPVSAASGSYYAKLVTDAAGRRRIVEVGTRIAQLGRSPALLTDVREQTAQAVLDATSDRREQAPLESVGDLVTGVLEHVQAVADGKIPPGIPTGLTAVDRLTGGMHNGQLIVPAGRTSMGKSVITQNWLVNAVKHTGRPGLLFSLEMPKDEMMQRLLSEFSEVPLTSIRSGSLTASEWEKLVEAERELRELPLYLVTSCTTIPAIRSYARRFRRAIGDLAILGVDYLQEVTPMDRGRRDTHELVGEIARSLKRMALDMEIPVIAPCQLNRGPESRTGKDANRPKLSDLRESGQIEQAADCVALLFRPEYYDKATQRRGQADIDIAKNRNGPTDMVSVASKLYIQKFVDLPEYGMPQPREWE
jgi:replicative DNA helicase